MLRRAIAVMGLGLLLGMLGGLLYPRLSAWLAVAPLPAIVLYANPVCNPVGGECSAWNQEVAVALRLGEGLRPLTAFPVQVNLQGRDVEQVTVRFDMPGMEMATQRFLLNRQADGIWRGQAMLPVCTSGRRDWVAMVEAEDRNVTYVGNFAFITER